MKQASPTRGPSPFSRKLVTLIENDAEELARIWLNDVKKNVKLPSYHTFNEEDLYKRAYEVYRHLGKWISWETSKEEISLQYRAHGAQRQQQGFELSEVVQALILMRRRLWDKVTFEGLLDTVLHMHQALDLNHQVVRYFDRAIYYTIIGFMKNLDLAEIIEKSTDG